MTTTLDDPVPLNVAAHLFFPAGGVTAGTLKREIRKGHLVPERIGGKYFVTRRAINEMRERCRVTQKVPGSTSAPAEGERRVGLSATMATKLQRDAVKATVNKLKKSSPIISRASTEAPKAPVIPIR